MSFPQPVAGYQPFLIAGFQTGLQTDLKPWLLPQDAFQSIVNGHVHNSVLQKRAGMKIFGNMNYSDGIVITVATNPIMGIKNFIDNNGDAKILIFDTKRAAIFNDATRVFDPLDIVDIFDGQPSSFVSAAAFGKTKAFLTSTFFFTNFNGDTTLPISPIRTYTTGATTTQFVPETTPTIGTRNYILASQFIFSIRSRLILLNTVEGPTFPSGTPATSTGTNFAQRMRWCRSFNPDTGGVAPVPGNPWDELTPGNGGFVDASTSEVIVGATQLEDTILVQFTNSVWLIEPTSDPALPFRWIKVNSYRTCSAPYASVAHDNYIVSYGNRGIVASSRNEVRRIDQKIENFMMEDVNTDFASRMYSARDYTEKRSWTLYPSSVDNILPGEEAETSNFALIRTEEEGAWSIYNVTLKDQDPINGTNMSCLGYGSFSIDQTFDDFPDDDDNTFDSPIADNTWNDFLQQAETEVFLAGDQTGRIITLNDGGDDLGIDIDFEVVSAGWNPFAQSGQQSQMGYVDFYIDADKNTDFTVEFFVDDVTSPYSVQQMNCLPNLGFISDIVNVTQANPAVFNAPGHGMTTGTEVYIYGVNGMDEIDGGPYIVTNIDVNNFSVATIDSTTFPVYEGGGQVVQRSFENDRCWKRTYAGAKGYQHYVRITNSDHNDVLYFHAFMPHFRPVGNRIIGG